MNLTFLKMNIKMNNIKMTPSLEDYIEAVFVVFLEKGYIRLTDISTRLGVKKSSAAHAISHLIEMNFIKKKKYGKIILTEEGIENGKKILNKHSIIKKLLSDVFGVSEENAESDACKIEHNISEETLTKIRDFLEKSIKQ